MVDWVFIGLMSLGMLSNSIQSLIAPFFPQIASKAGVPPIATGLIFGIQPFAALIFAPIFGWIMTKTGRKKLMIFCTLLLATAVCLFGFLP